MLRSDQGNQHPAHGRPQEEADVVGTLNESVGRDEFGSPDKQRDCRDQCRPEYRGHHRVQKDQYKEPFKRQMAESVQRRDQERQHGPNQIDPDHDLFLSETIEIDTDERTEEQGRNGLEQTHGRNHHCRAGELIDEPQQRHFIEAFAHLRGDLPPPEQSKIPGLDQAPASAIAVG